MPEPDFDQIARRVAEGTGVDRLGEWDSDDPDQVIRAIAEQLRQVWNARGAADRAAVEAADATAEPLEDVLIALRSLDR